MEHITKTREAYPVLKLTKHLFKIITIYVVDKDNFLKEKKKRNTLDGVNAEEEEAKLVISDLKVTDSFDKNESSQQSQS